MVVSIDHLKVSILELNLIVLKRRVVANNFKIASSD